MVASFESWRRAVELDESGKFGESEVSFSNAANQFYELGTRDEALSRAFFEYSTLMDAFSTVEKARAKRTTEKDYDSSLNLFGRANEILRATIHFGFLSSYISACATLEVALEFGSANDDLFQAYKNANALLEQSKIALSFRDEKDPMMLKIDAMLKFSIGGALKTEGAILSVEGNSVESKRKYAQSEILRKEYLELARLSETKIDFIPFFPLDDYRRASEGSFVLTYPDADNLWALNLGCNPATIRGIAGRGIELHLGIGESHPFPLKDLPKSKIRILYFDDITRREFDEGCIFLI